jgi:hypothetical protein
MFRLFHFLVEQNRRAGQILSGPAKDNFIMLA